MDIYEIIVKVVAAFGGAGVIIVGISTFIAKFWANRIAEKLSAKYELKLNKELENYKNSLNKTNHVSKARFDTEFEIFKQLHEAFTNLVRDAYFIAPEFAAVPVDEEARKKYENESYNKANASLIVAQDVLRKNAPFIQEDIYDKFNEIFGLCMKQTNAFERRWNVGIMASQAEKERMPLDAYQRTTEIKEKQAQLIKDIRHYLQSLELII